MTATAAAPPPPAPQSAPGAPNATGAQAVTAVPGMPADQTPPSVTAAPPSLWRRLIGTDRPSHLRALQVAVAAICILFGTLTSAQLISQWRATQDSVAQSNQLARVAAIKADLLHADALATNAFLVAGLEPATQRAAYDDSISSVSRLIADAADAEPADRTVLEQLNVRVLEYATTMEAARANNRQGFPVGSAYLAKASADLRASAIPLSDALIDANSVRATESMSQGSSWPLLGAAALALIALFVTNKWIAQRFKRRINVGLAGAAGIMLLVTLVALALHVTQARENDQVAATSFAVVRDGSALLGLANDAKANESLSLVARGSGASYEAAWQTSSREVARVLDSPTFIATGLSDDLVSKWNAYVSAHRTIIETDRAGDWEQAVAAATSSASGAASGTYATFDAATREAVTRSAAQTTSTLAGGSTLFVGLAVLAALAALLAAAVGWRGIGVRLAEYR